MMYCIPLTVWFLSQYHNLYKKYLRSGVGMGSHPYIGPCSFNLLIICGSVLWDWDDLCINSLVAVCTDRLSQHQAFVVLQGVQKQGS